MPSSHPVRRTFDIVKAKERMTRAGLTYADLAKPFGFERQAIGHWFRGRGEPSVQQMKVLAEQLGCHWLELVTDETIVVYKDVERARVEAMRNLDPASIAELDAFLAFKAAKQK